MQVLRYTGHPLVDVGVATIAAYCHKRDPDLLTESDLDEIACFIAAQYVVDPLKSFLNVAFPNSGFTNPAFERMPDKRTEYAQRVLYGYRPGTPRSDRKCVFTGQPVLGLAFSDKIPSGRAFRQHIPMLTGEGVINFYPGGDAGMPVSGEAMLCIQAFPMGCAKCGGKLLAVHSDNLDLTYDFAAEFLDYNLRALSLAQQQGSRKMPEAKATAKTLLIETLIKIEQRRSDEALESRPCSVTAYHLTNSGQSNPLDSRNPPLEMYHLPLELTGFVSEIVGPQHREEWGKIEARAWQIAASKRKGSSPEAEGTHEVTRARRNFLYEDLVRLPDNAGSFIRRYLLRIPVRTRFEDDPRGTYSLKDEAELVSWRLTELFLRRVMGMRKERVEQIRSLGDRLAAYVDGENDRRFFTSFFAEQRYDYFRTALIRASLSSVRRGGPPLIGLDPYIEVFEEGDEVVRSDWRLARDLVLIRIVEKLHQLGWLGKNPDAVPSQSDEAHPVLVGS